MGSKKSGIIMACIGGIASLTGFIMVFSGFADVGAWFAILGLIALILGIRISKDAEKDGRRIQAIESTNDFLFFRGHTLYIEKRDPKIRELVSINEFYTGNIKYNPEKLHYGSATVGGVTTGGFYKTGGNYYATNIQKSGSFKHLYYLGTSIHDIDLTPELYEKAKHSYIAKYLNGMQIEAIDRKGATAISGLTQDQNVIAQCSGRTHEECSEILDWICGVDKTLPPSTSKWKCPKCGRINQGYVGTCGCGERKP